MVNLCCYLLILDFSYESSFTGAVSRIYVHGDQVITLSVPVGFVSDNLVTKVILRFVLLNIQLVCPDWATQWQRVRPTQWHRVVRVGDPMAEGYTVQLHGSFLGS